MPLTNPANYCLRMSLAGLGTRLRRAREGLPASQEDAALILGVSERQVRRLEKGICVPSIEQLAKLALFYEVTIDSLVLGEKSAA